MHRMIVVAVVAALIGFGIGHVTQSEAQARPDVQRVSADAVHQQILRKLAWLDRDLRNIRANIGVTGLEPGSVMQRLQGLNSWTFTASTKLDRICRQVGTSC